MLKTKSTEQPELHISEERINDQINHVWGGKQTRQGQDQTKRRTRQITRQNEI